MKPTGTSVGNKAQAKTADLQGKNKGNLKTLQKATEKTDERKAKPFTGKVFYLDLPSKKNTESLEKDIQEFGGTIERFLSKDISYLISNKRETKFAQTLGRNSPVPSPESAHNGGNSSPHPSSRRGSHDGSSHKTGETAQMSRGKSLVNKVFKEQEFIPTNSILSNALAWGVRIVHVDDIRSYIEKKKKEFCFRKPSATTKASGKGNNVSKLVSHEAKGGRLKKPFIKVEDKSRHYRPMYQQLINFPMINYQTQKPCNPFDLDKKNSGIKEHNLTGIVRDRRLAIKPLQMVKKRRGYCECCLIKYEDLKAHLKSTQHKKFAESTQYEVVDKLISQFACDFTERGQLKDQEKRKKCSVAAYVLADNPTTTSIAKKEGESSKAQNKDYLLAPQQPCNNQNVCNSEDDHCQEELALSKQAVCSPASACYFSPCTELDTTEVANQIKTADCRNEKTENCAVDLTGLAFLNRDSVENDKEPTLQKNNRQENLTSKAPVLDLCQNKGNGLVERSLSFDENSAQEMQTGKSRSACRMSVAITNVSCNNDEDPLGFSKCSSELSSQQKRKQDSLDLGPTKCFRMDVEPSFGAIPNSDMKSHLQNEHLPCSGSQKENCINANEIRSSPPGKLYRKVKITSGKTKRVNQKQTVEMCCSKTVDQLVTEKGGTSWSPIQRLLELFQTSETEDTEFLGFVSPCEQDYSCSQLGLWEKDRYANDLLSLFLQPSSSSSFLGF
ncbi:protein DBF4 homolog A isoform X2 [Latimeria chalumnae]|uniref:protein DBF4 homolog A isoform X2 n=1 Tax=Latimeria chalumnae TaxID=7897 RepID=UPI0003C1ACC8|nr:PREDICTED: protein DBF4 homolog A isoform X2 [Latimeria chalumnae]|eukprot:XP_005998559.1 PREDICTED: protein DBF4 homolog A isoform X2 [Latimeria chalumnae]